MNKRINEEKQTFMTEHMQNQAKIMYEKLWEVTKILQIFVPYTYQSEYYAHREAAQALADALPVNFREEFLKIVNDKIRNMSNYSGD